MKITIHKYNRSQGYFKFKKCDYGYFRNRGEWEALTLTFGRYIIWLYRKSEYRHKWPVQCA